MEMYQNLGNFLDNNVSPFFVGSLVEKKVLFVNKIAKKMFQCTEETCDFEKIFQKTDDCMESLIARGLKKGKNTVLYNFVAITGQQEKIVVDLQFGFFNEAKTEMFLELMPKSDTRLSMALHQIHHSPRAEAILNLDEDLTILEYNEAFHRAFQVNETLVDAVFREKLPQGLQIDSKRKLLEEIHQCLQVNQYFKKDLVVMSSQGEEKWYSLELHKRELDNTGIKLMCYMVNIEKQVATEEKFDLVNQYLSVIQESTVDLLYRVDIETNTMYSYHEFQTISDNKKVIPDYVNTFFDKDTIHPEDKEKYLKGFHDFYKNDKILEEPVRFSLGGKEYQWYKIKGKKIFDKEGNLKEVFGALINVDKEVNMKEEVSALNQYLEAAQSISGESLFYVDMKTKILRQKGPVAVELGLTDEISNFPEGAYSYILENDLEKYKQFGKSTMEGKDSSVEVRVRTEKGDYQWYEIISTMIYDDFGGMKEVFGRMTNIQKERALKEEMTTMQKYFGVLQDFTDDILYRVDYPSKTLYHGYRETGLLKLDAVMPNYLESLIEQKIMHPDDVEKFLADTKAWHEDESVVCEVRLSLFDENYMWYSVKRRKFFDETGHLVEILGALVNIQKEREMEANYSELSQYFEAMQELSDDIFYRIEVDTMTLHHSIESLKEITKAKAIPDYVNTFIREKIVHPEDAEQYVLDLEAFDRDELMDIPTRFALIDDEYQWYIARGKKIFGDNGTVKEIWGRLISVQDTVEAKEELSTLNQFFTAMQEMDNDVVFRIELDTMTLIFKKMIAPNVWEKIEIPDFFNIFKRENQVHPDDRERYFRLAGGYFENTISDTDFQCDVRFALVTKEYVWYDIKCRKIYDKDGIAREVYGKLLNIDKERSLEDEYSHINQYFTAMQSLSNNILFYIDIKTKTFHHSDPNAESFGVPLVIPNYVETFIENRFIRPEDEEKYREYCSKLMSGESMEYEIQAAVNVGVYEWFHVRCQFIYNKNGIATEIFGTMENIEKRKELELRANHDGLTEVQNIKSFVEDVKKELKNPTNSVNHALVFIDMDDFKYVNDTFGHQFGDFVLEVFAKRLKNCIRESDMIGRLGGDEFVLYLKGIFSEEMAVDRANLIFERLKSPISNEKFSHKQGASLGIALIPPEGITYETLYDHADKALYQSKRQGKNQATVYSESPENES